MQQKNIHSQTLIRPFKFERLPIRGRIIRLVDLGGHVNSLEEGDLNTTTALAEMLASATVLAHDLKKGANISLQITGGKMAEVLLAKCNYKGVLRAFAKKVTPEGTLQQHNAANEGVFTITVDYSREQASYQSILPVGEEPISKTVETYIAQAAQLPTLFKVFVGKDSAGKTSCGAVFLQATAPLPSEIKDDWHRMALLVSTIKLEEALPHVLSEVDLISRLFAEDDVRLFPKQLLSFADHSNRPRMEEALKSIGPAECRTLLAEEGGTFTMTDEYTGQSELFTEGDLANLFGKDWQK